MKKLNLFITILICNLLFVITNVYAQTFPYGINYQAVARDANGNAKTNQSTGLRFTIRKTSSTGTVIWQEAQTANTNSMGQFNVTIGNGTKIAGSAATFSAIGWTSDVHYLEVEIQTGVTTYVSIGNQQLMSVPYALAIPLKVPTKTIYLSGNGTYTPPVGTLYIEVEMVGGGGAGARNADQIIAPTATTFGSLLCNPGQTYYSGTSNYGAGGTANIGIGFSGIAISGGKGAPYDGGSAAGGQGGSSAFGGNGAGGIDGGSNNNATNAQPNSGSGGGGNGSSTGAAGGGGAGGYIKATSTTLQANYSYNVGIGATSSSGGSGGSGVIIITEHYQ